MITAHLQKAHAFCSNHKEALSRDTRCGCFYCLSIFDPQKITDWIEDNKGTAICPYCGVDAVIGQSSGYPITPEFLGQMKAVWFEPTAPNRHDTK